MSMPQQICLEDLGQSADDERYLRCVALPSNEPGLALDRDGAVRWMPEEPAPYGLWISTDERLVLVRGVGAAPIVVVRTGRSLEAPAGRPVLLLDQDLLHLDDRTLRVHVHGPTSEVHAPEHLRGSALARFVRAVAATLALVAAAGAGGAASAAPPIEVRSHPPGATPARQVSCTVTSITPVKNGPLRVQMSCPAGATVGVGHRGTLYDQAGPIKDGVVTVKEVRGTSVLGETSLRKPVKATRAVFHVNW
jgi:hypothetical protein